MVLKPINNISTGKDYLLHFWPERDLIGGEGGGREVVPPAENMGGRGVRSPCAVNNAREKRPKGKEIVGGKARDRGRLLQGGEEPLIGREVTQEGLRRVQSSGPFWGKEKGFQTCTVIIQGKDERRFQGNNHLGREDGEGKKREKKKKRAAVRSLERTEKAIHTRVKAI